jgi:hypothetical protein
MGDMGLEEPDIEAPDADAAEQHHDVVPEPANDEVVEEAEVDKPPFEADRADAAEQARIVVPDDDEYR